MVNFNDDNVAWSPQPGPQTEAIRCPVFELFYGGARGGGKSDFLLGDFASHAGQYGEHAKGILFRRTIPEFQELKVRAFEIYPKIGARWKAAEATWIFPNGATLLLRHLYSPEDAALYQGHQYTWVGVDEAGNYPDAKAINLMRATLRSPHGIPVFLRLTGNPGGVGHLWLKGTYIDPSPPYVPHKYKPQPKEAPQLEVEAVFIPAKLEDNRILMENDPEYETRIAAAGGEGLFRAWRYGDWDAIVGAAFSEFRRDAHVTTIEKIPDTYRGIVGADWGYSKPGAFEAIFFGPDGNAVVALEYYFNGNVTEKMDAETVGFQFGTILKAHVDQGTIPHYPEYIGLDNSAWTKGDGRGGQWKTIAELLQKGLDRALRKNTVGIIAAPKGKNSRIQGKQIVHQMLKYDRDENGRIVDYMGPQLRIHARCLHLIRTLPTLPVDKKNAEDVDTEAEDHAYDALRYGLAVRMPEVARSARSARNENQHPGFSGKRRKKRYEPDTEGPVATVMAMAEFSGLELTNPDWEY